MNIIRKAYDGLGQMLGWNNGQFVWLDLSPASYSGRPVSQRSALQTIAVLRCVTLISGAAASLPIDVYVKKGGKRQPAEGHQVERLLDSAPNPFMSSMDFRSIMWTSFLLWGNAYAKIVRIDGRIIALWPLQPDCVEVKPQQTYIQYKYTPLGGGEPQYYTEADILHVRWHSLPGEWVGMSAIAQVRQAIARRQDQEEYGAKFFVNGARPSYAVQYPNKLGDKAIDNLRKSIQASNGGMENFHKVAVFEEGATVTTLSIPPGDAQFLEQEQYSDEQIAMLFGIPPSMLGMTSKVTSWGTGIAEQKLGFMTLTMAPLLTFHEKAYERCLLDNTRESKYFIKHNLNAFLRADIKTRYEAYSIGVDKGLLLRDETRAWEDLDPLPGGVGQIPTVQQQMISMADMGKHLDQPKPAASGAGNAAN